MHVESSILYNPLSSTIVFQMFQTVNVELVVYSHLSQAADTCSAHHSLEAFCTYPRCPTSRCNLPLEKFHTFTTAE